MKIGEWWIACDGKGDPYGVGETEEKAWLKAWSAYAWGGIYHEYFEDFLSKVRALGWTCEKVQIGRPE